MGRNTSPAVDPAEHNAQIWRQGNHVAEYDSRRLNPAEVILFVRYREAFARRVLEVGIGGGRLLGYLVQFGGEVHGVDIAPKMVEHCRVRWPSPQLHVADLATIDTVESGPFDVILIADKLIDVFADQQRREVLTRVRSLLAADGLLIFSANNLATLASESRKLSVMHRVNKIAGQAPRTTLGAIRRLPRRYANRRRLGPMQYRAADHAIVNDPSHDYELMHYYIARVDQERQLLELDFRPIEVLELSGDTVPPGQDGVGGALFYVAGTG